MIKARFSNQLCLLGYANEVGGSSWVSNNLTASNKQWKTPFHMACKEGQFDVVELIVNSQFMAFSTNLNAKHVNGMTHFDLAVPSTVIRYSNVLKWLIRLSI